MSRTRPERDHTRSHSSWMTEGNSGLASAIHWNSSRARMNLPLPGSRWPTSSRADFQFVTRAWASKESPTARAATSGTLELRLA